MKRNSRVQELNSNKDLIFFFEKFYRRDDSVHIIGNGPSLRKTDFSKFINGDLFVCNEFHRHDIFPTVKKNIRLYFQMDDMASLKYLCNLSGSSLDIFIDKYYNDLFSIEYTTIINNDLHDFFAKKNINKDLIKPMPTNFFKTKLKTKIYDISGLNVEIAFQIRHTPHAMIQMAIMLGYKKIYLHGLDHSYVKDRFEGLYYQPHFYEEVNETIKKADKIDMESRDLTSLFLDSYKTFLVYKEIGNLANLLGAKIYDCTVNGCLDMFEKKSL